MKIPDELKQQILTHAKAASPQEACGLVVLNEGELHYLPCQNIAATPTQFFEISPEDFISAEASGEIVAVVHSHPDSSTEKGLPYLSPADLACQRRLGLPFWLVCGGELQIFRPIAPLVGREFVNNRQDCRNIILDAYMLSGVELPDNSVYEFEWFEHSNLYEEGLAALGFERLTDEQPPQLGDVLLFQIGANVANHAGVYLGNQQFIHHSQNRLSARAIYDGYWLHTTHSIWRFKQWQQLHFTAILNDLAASQSS